MTAIEPTLEPIEDCPTAIPPVAVDDVDPTLRAPGQPFTLDVSTNDTACQAPGTSEWVADPSTFENVLAVSPLASPDGLMTVTPGGMACSYSFQYEIHCDGSPSGQIATVSGCSDALLLGPNLVTNPNFAQQSSSPVAAGGNFGGGWSASVPYVGQNVNPPDTSVAGHTGQAQYGPISGGFALLDQVPFPGDPVYGVPATNSWLYSNGNNTGAAYVSAQQVIPGLQPNTNYIFYAYTSSAAGPLTDFPDDSALQFQLDGVNFGPPFVELDHADPASGDNSTDLWHRRSWTWTSPPGQASTGVFSLLNASTGDVGNDLALTAISFREVLECDCP